MLAADNAMRRLFVALRIASQTSLTAVDGPMLPSASLANASADCSVCALSRMAGDANDPRIARTKGRFSATPLLMSKSTMSGFALLMRSSSCALLLDLPDTSNSDSELMYLKRCGSEFCFGYLGERKLMRTLANWLWLQVTKNLKTTLTIDTSVYP
jgi:hypothetical protein